MTYVVVKNKHMVVKTQNDGGNSTA